MEASILCQIYRTSVPYFGERSFTCSGVENVWRIVVFLHHKITEIFTSARYVVICEVRAWYSTYQPAGFLCQLFQNIMFVKFLIITKLSRNFRI